MTGRKRRRDQEGFTLVEFVVALSLLAFGVFAIMQVFYSGLRLSITSDARTRGSAVASREVEAMRAVAYTNVGMDASQLGGATTYTDANGQPYTYVTGGQTTPAGSQTVNATLFTVRRAVVWVAVGTNPRAYKRCVVVVTWHDTSGNHTVRQDDAVYPGGLGPVSPTPTSSTTSTTAPAYVVPGTPINLVAAPDAGYPTDAINLSWNATAPAGTSWEVNHSIDPTFQNSVTVDTTSLPLGQTSYQKGGLSSGTTFYFRVRQVGTNGSSGWSNVASTATQTPPSAACTVGSANITPAGGNKANNGNDALEYPSPQGYLYVSIQTSGVCTGLRLRFAPSIDTGQVNPPLVSQPGGVWDLRISGGSGYAWDIGIKDMLVVNTSDQVLAHVTFTVCAKNVTPCP